MMRYLGIGVAMLGIASLVFGIAFVVMANSTRAAVLDGMKEEGWPTLKYDETMYPYLGVTDAAITDGDVIDTAEDLDAAGDALVAARDKIMMGLEGVSGFAAFFGPSTFAAELDPAYGVDVDTLVFHEYAALLSFSGVLNVAQGALGMASLLQVVGIVSIIIGVALMLTGFGIFKLAPARQFSEAVEVKDQVEAKAKKNKEVLLPSYRSQAEHEAAH